MTYPTAYFRHCDRSTPPDPLSEKSHVHSHWYCHLLCNHSLWYVHVLCEQSGESASHLSSHSSIFYLCLCRLHWGSLPFLPNLLFSLLLVGNIIFSRASSAQLKIVLLCLCISWKYTTGWCLTTKSMPRSCHCPSEVARIDVKWPFYCRTGWQRCSLIILCFRLET